MEQSKRLRRPAAGGYARGEETRQRIIDAAVKLFGERGYDNASTREIASAAGVNAPALQYYFENKEGVYRSCAEFVTEELLAKFEPAIKRANAALKAGRGVAAQIDALLDLQEVMLDKVLLQPQAMSRKQFVARELTGEKPGHASKRLQQRLREPLNKVSLSLLARIAGSRSDDPVIRIRLLTLRAQAMPFYHSPGSALDLLGWKEIDEAKSLLLKTTILEQTRILLESWAAAR